MSERRDHDGLTGAEWEVLWCLFIHGPTEDGNVPSKSGRDSLIEGGWAFHYDGWTAISDKGLRAALRMEMDRKREKWLRARSARREP